MNKLDKKVVLLFFFQNFIGFAFLLPFVLIFFFGIFLGITGVTDSNIFFIFAPLFVIVYIVSIAIFSYLLAQFSYDNWKYELTKEAVKIEKGIIWKKYISIPYERVQNVDIYRGVFARILKLSDLQIQTAGYSGSVQSMGTEGRLPGLDMKLAEELREDLIKKVKNPTQQGL